MNKRITLLFIFLVCFLLVVILGASAQTPPPDKPLDAVRYMCYPGETGTGTPGDVTGDGAVNIQDALMCAKYYVGLQPDLPFFRFPSQWMEVHIPFAEMTQETWHDYYHGGTGVSSDYDVDKLTALQDVLSFEIDFHSMNNNEQGTVWIDDIALYKDEVGGYRRYITIYNFDEIPAGTSIGGNQRYYIYCLFGLSSISGTYEEGGPSGTGNCVMVKYNLGNRSQEGKTFLNETSLGLGIIIVYGGEPAEVPEGPNLGADVREYSGIRFWIRLQKSDDTGFASGVGDLGDMPNYLFRARLTTPGEVMGTSPLGSVYNFAGNYYGLNLDF